MPLRAGFSVLPPISRSSSVLRPEIRLRPEVRLQPDIRFFSAEAPQLRRRGFFNCNQPTPRLIVHSTGTEKSRASAQPLVLMLGHVNASATRCERFAEDYVEAGLPCVSLTLPSFDERVPPPSAGTAMEPIFRTTNDTTHFFLDRPIIVHCMAMNGVRALVALHRYLRANGLASHWSRIEAVFFDSAPARLTAVMQCFNWVLSRPYEGQTTVKGPPGVSLAKEIAISPYIFTRAAYWKTLERTASNEMWRFRLYEYLRDRVELPKIQYYIYSEADQIVNAHDVDAFIEVQKRRGAKVSRVRAAESSHMRHVVHDPQRFHRFLRQFIDDVCK